MKRFFVVLLLVLIIPLQLGYLYFKQPVQGEVAGISNQQSSTGKVTVSAYVGEYRFVLFGYTSPGALVTLNGQGIYDETYADHTGYYAFDDRFSPLSPREACLSAKDQFGRISAPTCLPPFPTKGDVSIGPVILAPTISLDKPNYFVGDEVILSGQTIPNSDIDLSMFTKRQSLLAKIFDIGNIIKPVEAYSVPKFSARSDDKGNYSMALPSSQSLNYRIFTKVDYKKSPSDSSVALTIKILPIWMIIVNFFGFLWALIQPRLLETAIFAQIIGLVIYFLRGFFTPFFLSNERSIIPYEDLYPVIEDDIHPMIEEEHPLMTNKN